MNFWSLLTDIGILLTASLVLGAILMRFGLNPLIGYLLAGVFLGGPGSIHLVKSPAEIEAIAELGVSLLLFSLGLEFSWNRLKSFPINTIYGGLFQVIITPLVIFATGYFLDFDLKLVGFFALIITLSSTATVLRSLIDLAEIDSPHGRNATAVLLLQDIAVVPFTIILSLLISSKEASSSNELFFTLFAVALLILGLYLLLNKIAVPLLSLLTLENNREMSILLATVISIGSAWAAHQVGISPAIGAFIAGIMLASSPFATQITADVSPLKIVFLTLFFGSVGIVADPVWILNNFLLVLGLTLLVILTKIFISFIIFRITNNTIAVSLSSAIVISQIGEFAFVLSTISKKGDLISEDLHQIIFSVIILSILITALMIKEAPRIGLFIQELFTKTKSSNEATSQEEASNHKVFILGFGPSGQEIARALTREDFKDITILDLSKRGIDQAKALGFDAHIGDVRQAEVLQHFSLRKANLIFITIPSQETVVKAVDICKRLAPNATIFVRSRFEAHSSLLKKAGAHHVVNEELTVGTSLGELGLKHLESLK